LTSRIKRERVKSLGKGIILSQKTGDTMTRKDYELIAEVIATAWHGSEDTQADLSNRMADALEGTNPRFNREMFLTACGVN
jgi:hypothetical protein